MKKNNLSNATIGLKKNASFKIRILLSQINERCDENIMCFLFGWRKLESQDIDECRQLIDNIFTKGSR